MIVTFTKLFVIKTVANNRSLSSNKLLIFSSEGCFLSRMALKSDGDNEKKAISEAEAKADTKSNTPANIIATIAEEEGACINTSLKTFANRHK